MPIQTRKLHYKALNGIDATQHVGRTGDVFFDPTSTTLRISDGTTAGGKEVGGSSYNSSQYIDYGPYSGGGPVAINLTKKYHWLVDLGVGNYYTLADGVDGQELVFLPANGLDYQGHEQSDVIVNSMKYWDDSRPSWWSDTRKTRIFGHADAVNMVGQVTAIWMNGAWCFSAGPVDMGTP